MEKTMENFNELLVTDDVFEISVDAATKIKDLLKKKEEYDKAEKELKAVLQAEMEARGIKKIHTNGILVNYIEPTQQESFDKAKFKEENEALYNKYVKFTNKNGYVKVSIKE